MKTFFLTALIWFNLLAAFSQEKQPAFSFNEDPKSYCMHICFDGKAYYTVNGGVADVGMITAFSINGDSLQSFPLPLDMRSIMYSAKNKCFYITTTENKVFKIVDLAAGTYELVFDNLYKNKQASLAIGPKSKYIYVFDNGTLSIHKFKGGALVTTLSGLKCGKDNRHGGATVAIGDKRNIYTWDSASKTIFVYDHEGQFIKSHTVSSGDFGYSLSYANDMIFVSHSPKKKVGTWFGYKL